MVDTMPARATVAQSVEAALVQGDLSKLPESDRIAYYKRVCESLGLNPFTKPFQYITLNQRLTLYATRDATDQLRKINTISINIVSREFVGELYIVTARATDKTGRTDESIGAVAVGGSKGDVLANALMKCETKAKRRVTLSIAGLGWLDETETETIPDARPGPAVNLTALADPESRRVELLDALKEVAKRSPKGWQGFLEWWPTQYAGTPETADVATLEAAYALLTKK
jgi:hypothetical protein